MSRSAGSNRRSGGRYSRSARSVGVSSPGFVARIGAALVAPRAALASSDREVAAGKTGSDAATLIALAFTAIHLRELVFVVWLGISTSVGAAANALAVSLSGAVARDLLTLFVAAAALSIAAGKRRALGRDFDLACVAFVPYIAVKLVAALLYQLTSLSPTPENATVVMGAAYLWGGAVLLLGWRQARSRAGDSPRAPGSTAVEVRGD